MTQWSYQQWEGWHSFLCVCHCDTKTLAAIVGRTLVKAASALSIQALAFQCYCRVTLEELNTNLCVSLYLCVTNLKLRCIFQQSASISPHFHFRSSKPLRSPSAHLHPSYRSLWLGYIFLTQESAKSFWAQKVF